MEKEKLWNSNYIKVMFTNFCLFFSFYLLTPLLPIYMAEQFDSSKDMIGLVLCGYSLTALFVRPFSGFIVDSFSRKRVLLFVLFLYFITFAGYIVAGSLVLFAIVRTLHGGPYGASSVANSTVAIDVLPSSRRNEGIGYYGISNNLGSAIAPSVAVLIYRYTHNFDILFWFAFIVAGLGFISSYMVKLPSRQPVKRNCKFSLDRFFLIKGWLIALNMLFFGFCWGLMSNYVAIYGKEHLGITSGTGTYFLLLSIGLIASRFQGSKSLREGRLVYSAIVGIILATIGYTIFILWPSTIGYYGSALLIGLGNGHIWPALQNMIIGVARHDERGTANSSILTTWDLGMGLGILAGGIVAEYFGYDACFRMNVAIHLVGLLLFVFFTRSFYKKNIMTDQG